MNTQHFRYAVEVERTGSITQAADHLFIGQPTLSKAIRELEETLSIEIFKRTPRGVIPTEKGADFLQYARAILKQIDRMEMLSDESTRRSGVLHAAVPPAEYTARAFSRFVMALPAEITMDVELMETGAMSAAQLVSTGRVQLGVMRYADRFDRYFSDFLANEGLASALLWQYSACLLTGAENAARSGSAEAIIRDGIEIRLSNDDVPYLSQRENVKGAGAPAHVHANTRAVLTELLRTIPRSFCLCAPERAEFLAEHALALFPLSGADNAWRDVLVFPQDHPFTEAEKAFIDLLHAEKNNIAFR